MGEASDQARNSSRDAEELRQIEYFDVLIVGTGISGIGAAYRLQTECRGKTFVILEARNAIGGTWDQFCYPGVRSDSDMYTLGFPFRPWKESKAIADGPAILRYLRETASEYGIDHKIRFGHQVTSATWSSANGMWTVTVLRDKSEIVCFRCRFLYMCCGYYDYAEGHSPKWQGMDRYRGRIVHPQHWPADLEYKDRRVIVIGSGATAVTLIPAMAKTAAHVTMLQRSPTYIISRPSHDRLANTLLQRLPVQLAYRIARWKHIALVTFFYHLARQEPEFTKKLILRLIKQQLSPGYDVGTHFSPRYNPWDQRLCLVPDSDLFEAIRSGRASVVTDEIETFTENGVRLKSGDEIEADVIVTATGLKLNVLGGMRVVIDGMSVNMVHTLKYKEIMYSDIPNLAWAFGYVNASWTLKTDLTAIYICRLLNYMEAHNYDYCTPRNRDKDVAEEFPVKLTSGYFQRASAILPKQGSKTPWRLYDTYPQDVLALRLGRVNDGTMEFSRCRNRSSSL